MTSKANPEHPDLPPPTKWGRFAQHLGDRVMELLRAAREVGFGRMSQWLWIALILVALGIPGSKMAMAAYLAYWIDRLAFPGFRPHQPAVIAFEIAQKMATPTRVAEVRHLRMLSAAFQARRALIIAACVVGSTIGL